MRASIYSQTTYLTTIHHGILMAASFSNSYQNINSSFNTYGVYLEQNSYSNNFNKDVIQNNTKMDVLHNSRFF